MAILAELKDPRDPRRHGDLRGGVARPAPRQGARVGDGRRGPPAAEPAGLQSAAGFLQAKIAERIEIRYTPRIELPARSRREAIDRRGPDPAGSPPEAADPEAEQTRRVRRPTSVLRRRQEPSNRSQEPPRTPAEPGPPTDTVQELDPQVSIPWPSLWQPPAAPPSSPRSTRSSRSTTSRSLPTRPHGDGAPAVRVLPGRRPLRRGGRGVRGAGAHVLRLERGPRHVDSELSEVMAGLPDPGRGQPRQARAARRLRGDLLLRPGRPAEEEPRPDRRVAGEDRRHDALRRGLRRAGGAGRPRHPHRRRHDGASCGCSSLGPTRTRPPAWCRGWSGPIAKAKGWSSARCCTNSAPTRCQPVHALGPRDLAGNQSGGQGSAAPTARAKTVFPGARAVCPDRRRGRPKKPHRRSEAKQETKGKEEAKERTGRRGRRTPRPRPDRRFRSRLSTRRQPTPRSPPRNRRSHPQPRSRSRQRRQGPGNRLLTRPPPSARGSRRADGPLSREEETRRHEEDLCQEADDTANLKTEPDIDLQDPGVEGSKAQTAIAPRSVPP